ncbi:acyltransferase [Massilia sp. IC2-477]|uniref:acyltransferase family protein n=1 Tax=Massilia sp. IC2-477 TaxID=2887198 RepID=UPI001D10A55E|nr:acyltransferase [Massilia sp. IC2-477]MCC2958788.1 acyltransferase [Massilia sp. IC2-477]
MYVYFYALKLFMNNHLATPERHRAASRGATSGSSVDLVIECARGLAALWVFLFHISAAIKQAIPALYPLALEGYRGVPVFFAISGYCIYAAAENAMARNAGAKTFLARRLKRIYPTFWASIAVVMCMPFVLEGLSAVKSGHFVFPQLAWLSYSPLDWFGLLTLSKELVDAQVGANDGYTRINTVYWSLAIEVQFYLVVFLAILMRRYAAAFLGMVSILSAYAIVSDTFNVPGLFINLWPGFLFGVLVRVAHTKGMTPFSFFGRYQFAASILLLGALALATAILAQLMDLGFIASAVIASIAIWCLGGLEHAVLTQFTLSKKTLKVCGMLLFPAVLLGQSSYSLYLLHGKVYQLPEMIARNLFPTTSPLYVIATVLLTCAICYGFYFFIERRFHNRRLPDPTPEAIPAAATLAQTAR